MKTVGQIMIEGEDVEIGSDSDVSDTSQISINISCQLGLNFQARHSNQVRKLTNIFHASYLALIGMSYGNKKNAHL